MLEPAFHGTARRHLGGALLIAVLLVGGCAQTAAPITATPGEGDTPLRARGQEPSWTLQLTGDQLQWQAGDQTFTAQMPDELLASLSEVDEGPLPATARAWLSDELELDVAAHEAEWSDDEIYLALPRPGGDGWLAIDRASGAVEAETTDRGWLSYFNDLHKGRNTGAAWGWFLDVFALACVVFCVTGFFLLQLHARQRAMTWPMVGAGLLVPLLLMFLLVH